MVAAAAKSLQSCPTLCDPIDGSPPGSPSLGFSRQEHWSGLPFPSPMRESASEVAQSYPCIVTAMQEIPVRFLGREDALEKDMATHFIILHSWRIPRDRGAWYATVHGVTKSRTRLSDLSTAQHIRSQVKEVTWETHPKPMV